MKRGAWVNRTRKAKFTGEFEPHIMGRKSDCRVKGCETKMLKGETHYAAAVEGYSPIMGPSICERPEYFGGNTPYVLICKKCYEKKMANPKWWMRRK